MCIKKKWIYNYSYGRPVLVDCGKCPSCQQAKANARAQRIRNHSKEGYIALFITLTYSNDYVPYCYKKDLFIASRFGTSQLPVFRNASCRWLRSGVLSVDYRQRQIDSFFGHDIVKDGFGNFWIPCLTRADGCVGVLYYPDVQRFMKRLRIELQRKYNYEDKITYYATGEYGGKTFRPHFHLLLYVRTDFVQTIKSIIAKAWPYGDMFRSDKRIQIAYDASSYVASYTNSSTSLPKIFTSFAFRPSHASSKFFGHGLRAFSLDSLLEKVKRGDFSYTRTVIKDGVPVLASVPIPKYVVNRYFPRFKGDFRLNSLEIRELLLSPANLWRFTYQRLGYCDISEEDLYKLSVRLRHAFEYYHSVTGKTIFDYAIDYCEVWSCRFNYCFKNSYRDQTDFSDFYENIANVYLPDDSEYKIHAPTLSFDVNYQFDPNRRSDIVRLTTELMNLFYLRDKYKKVVGFALSSLYDDM